jgi:hypothetical protein
MFSKYKIVYVIAQRPGRIYGYAQNRGFLSVTMQLKALIFDRIYRIYRME